MASLALAAILVGRHITLVSTSLDGSLRCASACRSKSDRKVEIERRNDVNFYPWLRGEHLPEVVQFAITNISNILAITCDMLAN